MLVIHLNIYLHQGRADTVVNFDLTFLTEKIVRSEKEDSYTYFKDYYVKKFHFAAIIGCL